MEIESKIETTMNKIHTNLTSEKMKEWMQKNIVNEAEEYGGTNKNINDNKSDAINENKLYKN